jgi:hypothetical protein
MRINSDGDVALAGNIGLGGATPSTSGTGITFPATASASTDANTLDDYEEGTWTPTYVPTGPNFTSVVYSAQAGDYTKIGRQVTIRYQMQTSSITKGSASGAVRINGMPFTATNSGSGVVWGNTGWLGDNPFSALASGTQIFINYRTSVNGRDFPIEVEDFATGASSNNIYMTITYFT